MFYSKSTNGFYERLIHGNNIPDDGVEITKEKYAVLLEGQSNGRQITADENGYPVLVDPRDLMKLEDHESAKNREIEQNRNSALTDPSASVTTDDGNLWQADPKSMGDLNKAITLFTAAGGTLPGYEWRDANNVNHPADLQLLVAIGIKRAEQENAIWQHSWALKDQLRAVMADESLSDAEKIAAIELIKWMLGNE